MQFCESVEFQKCIAKGKFRVMLELGFGSGQKFANCTCAISKLCSTFCKL